MKAGQNYNLRKQMFAGTEQDRRQAHAWINDYSANMLAKSQRQQAAAINENELTGECNEQETQDDRHQG